MSMVLNRVKRVVPYAACPGTRTCLVLMTLHGIEDGPQFAFYLVAVHFVALPLGLCLELRSSTDQVVVLDRPPPQVTALLGNARALERHHSSFILYRLQSRYCRRDIHSITGIPSLWHASTVRARDLTCLAASTCSGLRQHSALGSHATKTAGGLRWLAWSIGVARIRTYSYKFYCAAPCTTSNHYPCGTLVLPLLSRWMG